MDLRADVQPLDDLSAFYTPASTAVCLASWAIRTGRERVLEPSFGGGALIEAAAGRAKSVGGAGLPELVGFDVDKAAVDSLRPDYNGTPVRLIWQDFLAVNPAKYGSFDVVLSNPPFTRNHSISAERRAELRRRFETKGAAGIWVHFVLHSMKFLRAGGRLACVVPASCFFADYASDLLQRLCSKFQTVELLRLNEKPQWSGGAQEAGAFLFADGYLQGPCEEVTKGFWLRGRGPVGDFDATSSAFAELSLASRAFGEIAEIGIGDVTGCNRVFLLSSEERQIDEIPYSQLSPIVSRARHISGLVVTKRELADLADQGEKTWLLSPTDIARRNSAVRRRLARVSSIKRKDTVWLNKRDPWWKVTTGPKCDAVFSYMNDQGLRLARVSPGVRCTNTLHRVTFKADADDRQQIAAMLTMASSFGQLAAERLGRVYGGGVLKFEIRETRRLPLLPAEDNTDLRAWMEVDVALRRGDREAATALAEEMLLAPLIGSSWVTAAREFAWELRERRMARRAGSAQRG
jgi:hypothetical protein